MLTDISLVQLLAVFGAAFLVGLGKGGVPGAGNCAVAVFALVFPAKASVGILLPVLIAADVVAVLVYRRHAHWQHLWRIMPWTTVGIILGWVFMDHIDDNNFRFVIGGLLIALALIHFGRVAAGRFTAANAEATGEVSHSRVFAGFAGILGGIATQVANAAGPIMALYLLSVRLPKYAFIGTGAWFFLLMNCFKVPFMVDLGLINGTSIRTSGILAAAAIAGAVVAPMIVRHISQQWFAGLMWGVVIVSAALLLLS